MTKKERKAIYALEAQNLRLAHHLEGALNMLRDNLAALPDGAAGLISKAEAVLVGQDDQPTSGNYAARLAELEAENASLCAKLGAESARLKTTHTRLQELHESAEWFMQIYRFPLSWERELSKAAFYELQDSSFRAANELEAQINQ